MQPSLYLIDEDSVDLWDLAKLLFRRWYFAVPMLILSMVSVLMFSSTVKPDYSASGHLQLLPAAGSTDSGSGTVTPSKAPPRVHNPWGDLGYQALGQAAIVKVEDDSVTKQLKANGLTTNFTVTIEYGTSFFSIEAVGSSPAQATGTVQQLMKVLTDLVLAEQTRFGVAKEDQISTLRLDNGDNVKVVTSKKKRVLIVAGGIAVLVTAGSSIGLDALLRLGQRRRQRRRAGLPDPVEGAAVKSVAHPPSGSVAPNDTNTSTKIIPVSPAIGSVNGHPAGSPVTRGGDFTKLYASAPPGGYSSSRHEMDEQAQNTEHGRPHNLGRVAVPRSVDLRPAEEDDFSGLPPDATVVLPLPKGGWPDERKTT